ncbi:MAG: metalloregulator ArsR/SmtB family transcription factor [Magnetococcales bacterium]|nr:metalloregulator ArsR/SmtB family transcription factor [Magnetococcales bacterium]
MINLDKWAAKYKALSEPLRIRLLCLVAASPDICVCDLITITGVSQSMVSRHLAYLRNSGWLVARRQKLWMHYSVAKQEGKMDQAILEDLQKYGELSQQIKTDLAQLAEITAQDNSSRSC